MSVHSLFLPSPSPPLLTSRTISQSLTLISHVASGEEVVQKWRRGLEDRPPAMTNEHVHWHENDRKYAHLVGKYHSFCNILNVPASTVERYLL